MTEERDPMGRADRLRLVLATPLGEDLCQQLELLEPRVTLLRDHDLLPPVRFAGDHTGDPSWTRTPAQQAEFDSLLDSAEALFGIPDESGRALGRTVAANSGLRWVQTMASGAATQLAGARLSPEDFARVTFTTAAGVHAATLAEFALFGLLAGAKTLPRLVAQQRERLWTDRWAMGQVGDQTVLVLGLGAIGRETARLAAALGAHVIGANRRPVDVPGVHRVVRLDQLAEVVPEVDAIVIALPGTASTTGLIDAGVLAAARPGLTIVNVGRGSVIDEPALIAALDSGSVGFAALDVTAVEPLAVNSPLWSHPRVLISPHTAALSPLENRRITELAAANAGRLIDGDPLVNVVTAADLL